MGALQGLKILVPESRELDLFAAMLEGEGAVALRCPMVRILPLHDTADVRRWIGLCRDGAFDELILLTGEGLRHLLAVSEPDQEAFIASLRGKRITVRGPKPTRALREIGLSPDVTAPDPTSEGVLRTFGDADLTGRRIGVQLYPGEGGERMASALRRRGADVFTVTPYRYATEAETEVVGDFIRRLATGEIDVIAFTASLQIERLMWVAKETGMEEELKTGLRRTAIASIGPVMQAALEKYGLTAAIQPESSFHMKPLARAIARWSSTNVVTDDHGVHPW